MPTISIKELHEATGECVRRAASSRSPVIVTVHGKPIAVLANPSLVRPKRRKRVLLPEFEALMAKGIQTNSIDDLDAVRGDR